MSANDYWAKAQSGSPGTNLAEMQARLYAGETTQRMMEKFDHTLQTFTMGISDPTELDAAQQRAQALLTEKMAIANRFSSRTGSGLCGTTRRDHSSGPRGKPEPLG